ncbi:GntR family transcriptional regulator [Garciella nitratireducens]|uniref:GntR family transcriptional regulator n=1 Tax=Garciella nitratireducens TaxID=218205 RepID=UPI000DE824AD|nr:GntR family transcriptional regulator [Garciella nitratireducens]RBP42863.1 GntR family transcriptional regulator [Garciella nitratireducens]
MNFDYRTPRYLMVIEQIKERIKKEELQPGERLPSETEFSKQLGVSRSTLREALRILEEENIIIRKHEIGTFVNQKPVFNKGIEELFSITDIIKREGKIPSTKIYFTGYVQAHGNETHKLNLQKEEQVFLVKRVRFADNIPLVYCIDKIPAHLLPKEYTFQQESILDSLEKIGIIITYAEAEIKTISYHQKISKIMECDKDTPLLILKQIHYDQHNRPVLYSINYFRSDQISFHVLRKRML